MNNQAAQTMPELPEPWTIRYHDDATGREIGPPTPLYTADQMHQYARDYAAMLAAAPAASGVDTSTNEAWAARAQEKIAAMEAASGGEGRLTRAEAITEFRSRTAASVSERAREYRHSTHHVNRGPESLPCYCEATSDHLVGEEASNGEALARRFHEAYERLAPSFGYETRTETRQFDPTTPNGRLMIAVCSEIALEQALTQQRGESSVRIEDLGIHTPMRHAERADAEQAYSITAHDFEKNPIGSRDWTIYWRGWWHRSQLYTTPQPSADAVREYDRELIARMLETPAVFEDASRREQACLLREADNLEADARTVVRATDDHQQNAAQTAPLCEECGIELGERIGALVVMQ